MVCCVFDCQYGSRAYHGPSRTTHQFPEYQTKMYNKWVKAINIVRFSPTKKTFVCGFHFKPEDYHRPEENLNNKGKPKIRSTLRPTAVPSLYMRGGQPDYSRTAQLEISKKGILNDHGTLFSNLPLIQNTDSETTISKAETNEVEFAPIVDHSSNLEIPHIGQEIEIEGNCKFY